MFSIFEFFVELFESDLFSDFKIRFFFQNRRQIVDFFGNFVAFEFIIGSELKIFIPNPEERLPKSIFLALQYVTRAKISTNWIFPNFPFARY